MLFEYYVDDAWPYAGPNQVAVRTNKYKLIDNFLEDDIDELYDLIKDPGEMKNLINDDNYNNIEKELREESKKLQKQYKYNPDRDWWLRTQVRK
jgi:N-acetylglucosamine-6-sulfatase